MDRIGKSINNINTTSNTTSGVQYFLVSEENSGQRIDNFLMTHLKGVPKTHIYKIVRKGEVRVNKGRIKPDYKLHSGDSVRIPPIRTSETPHRIPLKVEKNLLNEILYEDEDLIIINKPFGLAVHGGSGLNFGVIEAFRILKPKIKSLELVHRLDRETSGCLMLSKRRSALLYLHDKLKSGEIQKQYIALVKGDWQKDSIIDVPLMKNQLKSGERVVKVNFEQGKPSQTGFHILAKFPINLNCHHVSLMEINLLTGRTHQIRVHSQYAGHEIAGDPKYGDETFNRYMKTKGLNRLFLHANRLSFNSPRTGERLTIDAPLDNTLSRVIHELEREE